MFNRWPFTIKPPNFIDNNLIFQSDSFNLIIVSNIISCQVHILWSLMFSAKFAVYDVKASVQELTITSNVFRKTLITILKFQLTACMITLNWAFLVYQAPPIFWNHGNMTNWNWDMIFKIQLHSTCSNLC